MTEPLLIEFSIRPEKLDGFLTFLTDIIADTRTFEGCEHVEVWEEEGTPGSVLLYQVWESRAKQEEYSAWRAETGTLNRLGEFLTGAAKVRWLKKHDT